MFAYGVRQADALAMKRVLIMEMLCLGKDWLCAVRRMNGQEHGTVPGKVFRRGRNDTIASVSQTFRR